MDEDVFPLTDNEYRFVKSSLYHLSDYEGDIISINNHFEIFISGQSPRFIETKYHREVNSRTFNLFNLFGATLRLFEKEVDRGYHLSDIPPGVCLNGSEESVKEARKLLEDILERELDVDYELPEVRETGFEIKY